MSKEEKQLCHCEGTSNPNKRVRFAKSAGIGAVLLTALSLFASCTQDEISGGSNDDRPSTLALGTVKAAGIDVKQVATRAVATTDYPTTDSIGFFVKADAANGYVACDNRKGKYSTARQLWLPVDTIWLNKHNADIAIYAPYDASHTTPATLNLTAALRPADGSKDIWCKHITANNTSKSPAVTLEHVYSRLYLTVTRDATYTADASLTALDVKGDEVYESATYKPFETAPYTYSSTTGLAPTVTAQTLNASTASATYDLLLIPTPLTGDITLTLTVDGKKMETIIEKTRFTGSKLDAGKQYNVGLALKPGKLEITSVSMVKWDALPEINGGQAEFDEIIDAIDIGLPFVIAPGNLRAVKPTGSSTYEYSFAEEQGYYSGIAGAAYDATIGGDYFCFNTLDPSATTGPIGEWNNDQDPCRQVDGGEWYTPSLDQMNAMNANAKGIVWGEYTMSDGSKKNGMYFGTTTVPSKAGQNKYVFLPAGGLRGGGSNWTGIGVSMYYWSSTSDESKQGGYYFYSDGGSSPMSRASNRNGNLLIRCVKDKPKPAHAIDIPGVDFYAADGNVIATKQAGGGYTYAFADEQGYCSGKVNTTYNPADGDYFCWNTLDPADNEPNTTSVWDDTRDVCRKIGDGKWYTPTLAQWNLLIDNGYAWGRYKLSDGTDIPGVYFGTTSEPSESEQDNFLFLPGNIYVQEDGTFPRMTHDFGFYWGSIAGTEGKIPYITYYVNMELNSGERNSLKMKYSVRCIRDK